MVEKISKSTGGTTCHRGGGAITDEGWATLRAPQLHELVFCARRECGIAEGVRCVGACVCLADSSPSLHPLCVSLHVVNTARAAKDCELTFRPHHLPKRQQLAVAAHSICVLARARAFVCKWNIIAAVQTKNSECTQFHKIIACSSEHFYHNQSSYYTSRCVAVRVAFDTPRRTRPTVQKNILFISAQRQCFFLQTRAPAGYSWHRVQERPCLDRWGARARRSPSTEHSYFFLGSERSVYRVVWPVGNQALSCGCRWHRLASVARVFYAIVHGTIISRRSNGPLRRKTSLLRPM